MNKEVPVYTGLNKEFEKRYLKKKEECRNYHKMIKNSDYGIQEFFYSVQNAKAENSRKDNYENPEFEE